MRVHRCGQSRIDRHDSPTRYGKAPGSAANRCRLSLAAIRRRTSLARPEIDGVVGTGAYASIVEVLDEARAVGRPCVCISKQIPNTIFLPRLITTPRATAYLKVAEGCDHPCTFCIIPQLRGKFRSRSRESILMEARALVGAGTKELILIAQDTSMYGRDRGERRGGLGKLLHELHEIEGLEWIRLLYLYPATVDDELIEAMATLPKVAKYMDMPLQHAQPRDAARDAAAPRTASAISRSSKISASAFPASRLRSTFIIGFPGETDEHVAYLEEWIGRAELDRVGFFTYSQEDGTPAALLANQVPTKVQRARLLRLRDAQRLASERARGRRIGRIERVLVEDRRALKKSDPLRGALGVTHAWCGRSMGEAPGVDGGVYFAQDANPGDIVEVTLRGATAFDFYGDLVSTPTLATV